MAYLVENLLPDRPQKSGARSGKPIVRLIFGDGSSRELPDDPELRKRLSYVVDGLLAARERD